MDFVVLAVLVTLVLITGIGLGMLAAPRLYRWSERDDEEPHDDGSG